MLMLAWVCTPSTHGGLVLPLHQPSWHGMDLRVEAYGEGDGRGLPGQMDLKGRSAWKGHSATRCDDSY